MIASKIQAVLTKHATWLRNDPDGVCADLSEDNLRGANLHGANLSEANLRGADLRGADLSEADLHGANLSEADLSEADLHGANLSEANLRGVYLHGVYLSVSNLREADLSEADLREANLSGANLSAANLREADLSGADLRGADLSEADLRGANLSEADLSEADLRGADLSGADLSGADLREANLSEVKGLLDPVVWLSQFETDVDGILVYRAKMGYRFHPPHWTFESGKFLTEIVNPLRTNSCGCGVSFSTRQWIEKEWKSKKKEVWLCRIHWRDFASVVVPYNTEGKARCGRLELVQRAD